MSHPLIPLACSTQTKAYLSCLPDERGEDASSFVACHGLDLWPYCPWQPLRPLSARRGSGNGLACAEAPEVYFISPSRSHLVRMSVARTATCNGSYGEPRRRRRTTGARYLGNLVICKPIYACRQSCYAACICHRKLRDISLQSSSISAANRYDRSEGGHCGAGSCPISETVFAYCQGIRYNLQQLLQARWKLPKLLGGVRLWLRTGVVCVCKAMQALPGLHPRFAFLIVHRKALQ